MSAGRQPLPLSGRCPHPRVCSLTFAGQTCLPRSWAPRPSVPSMHSAQGVEPGLRAHEMLPTRDPVTKGTTDEHREKPQGCSQGQSKGGSPTRSRVTAVTGAWAELPAQSARGSSPGSLGATAATSHPVPPTPAVILLRVFCTWGFQHFRHGPCAPEALLSPGGAVACGPGPRSLQAAGPQQGAEWGQGEDKPWLLKACLVQGETRARSWEPQALAVRRRLWSPEIWSQRPQGTMALAVMRGSG